MARERTERFMSGPSATGIGAPPRATGLRIAAILIAHAAATVALAVTLSAWRDEAYSLHTAGGTLAQTWTDALRFEMQPPLYFALLWLWRRAGESILEARLLSVACALAVVWVAVPLARRYVPSVPPALVAALVAFNPFTIWAAVEIRLYALALLLSALLLLFFHDGYVSDAPSLRSRLLHAVVAVAALYTQYYLGFLLVAGAIALAALRRWRSLRAYLVAMAAVCAVFSPMLLILAEQVWGHAGTVATFPSPRHALRLLAFRMQDYALPTSFAPASARWIAFGLLLLAALWIAARSARAAWTSGETVLASLTASLAACFYVVLLETGEELLAAKHTVALFLPVVLCVLAALARWGGARALGAWTLLAGASYALALATTYAPGAKDGDAARVARTLMAEERPGQPILAFNAEQAVPLALYYRGRNRIVAVPRPMHFRTFEVHDFVLHGEAEIWAALGGRPAPGQEVWLLTGGLQRYLDVSYGFDVLEEAVGRSFDVVQDRRFFKARLRLLRAR